MNLPSRFLLVVALAASFSARAADRILVVLPFDVTRAEGKLTAGARASVEEMLRDEAANALAVSGWTVMTGEATQSLLQASGIDVTRCSDGQCLVGPAKAMNVDRFIGGAIQHSEGFFTASIRLIDAKSGNIAASVRLESRTVRGLRKAFAARAARFFERTGLLEAAPPAAAPPPAPAPQAAPPPSGLAEKGTLKVTTLPSGARVLIDGNEVGKTPLNRQLDPGTYQLTVELPGYATQSRALEIEGGKTVVFNEALFAAAGYIDVAVSPGAAARAARVTIDGAPAGVGRQGPWKAGSHTVRAESQGFEPATLSVDVDNGGTASAKLALEALPGWLLLSVNVEADCKAGNVRVHVGPGEAMRVDVPPGAARVVCSRGGYAEGRAAVEVAPGAATPVRVALVRDPAAAGKTVSASAAAQDSPAGTVAMLDFRAGFKGQESQPVDATWFSDAVRASLLSEAPALRLLGREELQSALALTEQRLAECTADCELDVGRRAAADFVVAGEVLRTGAQYKLRLRMYRTATGAQVSTLASGATVDALDSGIPTSVRELVRGIR